MLGAYLLRNPGARIATLIPFGIFTRIMAVPAWFFLLVWIGIQIISQVGESHAGQDTGGVAYLAHIGGFVAGMGLIFFLRTQTGLKRRRSPSPFQPFVFQFFSFSAFRSRRRPIDHIPHLPREGRTA